MPRPSIGHVVRATAARLSVKESRTLSRRERQRPRDGTSWFTPQERALTEALACVIVPSDDTSPGAEDAGVTDALDRLLASSPERQVLYARGLLSFDDWAQRKHGRAFAMLPLAQQVDLLREADRIHRGRSGEPGALRAVKRLYYMWRLPAVDLFPQLVQDVLGAFYTSWVSWVWLRYDGPPMPHGYPDLSARAGMERSR